MIPEKERKKCFFFVLNRHLILQIFYPDRSQSLTWSIAAPSCDALICSGYFRFPRQLTWNCGVIVKQALSPNLAPSLSIPFGNPLSGTAPQVFLFSVLCWAVTPQLLSLYYFSVPRSLHKTLKEHWKGELKLQLSIRIGELHVSMHSL